MSVPFKYRQHIRDIHESFHDGKPIAEEELMGVMEIIAAAEHRALIEPYRAQCPLSSNAFLALMYELQKASKIPYDELVWNYIRGALRKGIFNGEDRTDVKALRSTLDPMMRAVHLGVPNLYKEHAPPDDEGRISIDQLCDVFRSLYPANQVVYLEMYKWARATKVAKGRGGVSARAKTFEEVRPANAAAASPVALAAPSPSPASAAALPEPQPRDPASMEAPTAAISATAAADACRAANPQQTTLQTQAVSEEGPQVASRQASQVTEESRTRPGGDPPTDALSKPSGAPGEVRQPADGKQPSDDGATVAAPFPIATSAAAPPSLRAEETVEAAAVKEAQADVQHTPCVLPEKKKEEMPLPSALPTEAVPLPFRSSHVAQADEEGKDVPRPPREAAEVPSVLPTPAGSFSCLQLPPAVQLERRPGLDFNPPRIRDMEPPARKANSPTEGDQTLSPPPRLRGHEELPSWEYEEALLDAMLSRVAPGKPVDPQVVDYIEELARQEKELKSALHDEMENLTSNMLACEVVEQRMLLLRAQRKSQCFDRMESRRCKLLEEMETYLSRVRKTHAQHAALLDGAKVTAVVASRKDARSSRYDGTTSSHARQGSGEVVSVFTPPPLPPSSAERRGRRLQQEWRLGERLQSMQNEPPAAAWTPNVFLPQEPRPPVHQLLSGMGTELPQRGFSAYPLGSAPQRQSVQVVHSRPAQHHPQLQSGLFDEEDLAFLVRSDTQSLHSPLPRQPGSRGVNPHLTAEVAAKVLTSSQLQRKIEERLAVRLSGNSQPL
ncbi:uncharacterized protein Tco025E_06211 [Trypanosoma conorhini]|uniref:Uncharacterized protein n=1 Tax=Trypanosoma conorhini TaxID=83891 RepID=A0A3R7N613_9TRYP|nr:uncharacterized protein Tco025E_06211 [Trypanosoma conorhini]RNF13366.1 hypothetical protein Tco025E_06211 [Trypanosoma conorhini]